MANEITINASLSVVNVSDKSEMKPGQLTDTQTTIGSTSPMQTIGTSEEVFATTDIVTPGWVMFRNIDPTNYVDWGPESGGAMVNLGRMKPGKTAGPFFLYPAVVIRMKANTAACKVRAVVVEL